MYRRCISSSVRFLRIYVAKYNLNISNVFIEFLVIVYKEPWHEIKIKEHELETLLRTLFAFKQKAYRILWEFVKIVTLGEVSRTADVHFRKV